MVLRFRSILLTASALALSFSGSVPAQAQEGLEGTQAVLNQLDNPTHNRPQSSNWYVDLSVQRKIAADDFLIPAGTDWWQIDAISMIGMMCMDPGLGDEVHIAFYSNAGDSIDGKPDAVLFDLRTDVIQGMSHSCSAADAEMQYDLVPQSKVWLRPDAKYWLSIRGVVSGEVYDRNLWWTGREGWLNQPAFYYSGGSLSSCNEKWVQLNVCDGEALGDDMSWSMTYTAFRPDLLYLPMLRR